MNISRIGFVVAYFDILSALVDYSRGNIVSNYVDDSVVEFNISGIDCAIDATAVAISPFRCLYD